MRLIGAPSLSHVRRIIRLSRSQFYDISIRLKSLGETSLFRAFVIGCQQTICFECGVCRRSGSVGLFTAQLWGVDWSA